MGQKISIIKNIYNNNNRLTNNNTVTSSLFYLIFNSILLYFLKLSFNDFNGFVYLLVLYCILQDYYLWGKIRGKK